MISRFRFTIGILGGVGLVAACSATGGSTFTNSTGHGGNGNGGSGTGNGGGDIIITSSSGSGSSGGVNCNHDPNTDGDGDGWTGAEGDCNDCDPNVNPGAVDTSNAGDGGTSTADNDCSGSFNPPQPCDQSLNIDTADAMDGARAVDLCQTAQANPATKKDKKWGVLAAKWVLPDGSDPTQNPSVDMTAYHLGHGVLHSFGSNVHVQAGARMLGLSSGSARQPSDPGYQDVGGFDKGYTSGQPTGFPKESPLCQSGATTGEAHDGAALELTIRTPTNATGFTFDFNFFSYEWPDYVCSMFNDFFVAYLTPKPANQSDGNISFDKQGNPVSVNNAFVDICDCASAFDFSCTPPAGGCCAGGKPFACALGTSGLSGTGFDGHGSTGWLVTKAPVKGGEKITIRWTVYDAGDGILDTTTLIDNWQWIANGGSVSVGTDPISTPK